MLMSRVLTAYPDVIDDTVLARVSRLGPAIPKDEVEAKHHVHRPPPGRRRSWGREVAGNTMIVVETRHVGIIYSFLGCCYAVLVAGPPRRRQFSSSVSDN